MIFFLLPNHYTYTSEPPNSSWSSLFSGETYPRQIQRRAEKKKTRFESPFQNLSLATQSLFTQDLSGYSLRPSTPSFPGPVPEIESSDPFQCETLLITTITNAIPDKLSIDLGEGRPTLSGGLPFSSTTINERRLSLPQTPSEIRSPFNPSLSISRPGVS